MIVYALGVLVLALWLTAIVQHSLSAVIWEVPLNLCGWWICSRWEAASL